MPPIGDGVSRLKADIQARATVFCVCAAARDYHVGARDAEEIFLGAVERGYLRRNVGQRNEERYFLPTLPTERLARRLAAEGAEATAAVDRAYGILCEAFPSFRIGASLADQDPMVRAYFLRLFHRLQELGVLPETTSNAVFNYQGMTLLMEQCFSSRDRLIECLQDPELLDALAKGGAIALNVFLCHASDDKAAVRSLYERLASDGVQPWFDERNLLPGQDWDLEIRRAVRASDVVVACLSPRSVSKRGYVQKEIRLALDVADEQPEGTIFIVPVKLEATDVPDRLRRWHWVDLTDHDGYSRLLAALRAREAELGGAARSEDSIE